jgi:hypothetical protein
MQKKERIAQLLANGVVASDISSIVGCSSMYLSSLKEDEEFRGFVAHYQSATAEESKQVEDERLDDKYIGLEDKLVRTLSQNVEMMEPAQAIRLLKDVGERNDRRRTGINQQGSQGNLVHVTINVPAAALSRPGFQLSAQKEVVAVGGRALAPMSMEGVSSLIEAKRGRMAPSTLPAVEGEYLGYTQAEMLAEM